MKRAVDDQPRPGRFVLTGSVRAELLAPSWAATGRVVRLTQWGLCQRELTGDIGRESFFDRVFQGDVESIRPPSTTVGLRDYVEMALVGGVGIVTKRCSLDLTIEADDGGDLPPRSRGLTHSPGPHQHDRGQPIENLPQGAVDEAGTIRTINHRSGSVAVQRPRISLYAIAR